LDLRALRCTSDTAVTPRIRSQYLLRPKYLFSSSLTSSLTFVLDFAQLDFAVHFLELLLEVLKNEKEKKIGSSYREK
jgi:hypothetical protein